MSLESATYVAGLVSTNPTATDSKSQGDDHLRLIKSTLLNSFAGFPGMVVVTGSEAQGSTVNDYTVTVSPAPSAYTTSMVVLFKAAHANTGAATVQVNALGTKPLIAVDGSALKTGDIESGGVVAAWYDGTSFYVISGNDRANRNGDTYSGSHVMTGATVTVATQSALDNSTKAASTAYADAAVAAEASLRSSADTTLQTNINSEASTRAAADTALQNSKADLASPAFTGTPTAPTATAGTSTTQIATTAFVMAQAFSAALPAQTGNAGKFVTTDGTNASWADAVTPTGTQTLTNKTLVAPVNTGARETRVAMGAGTAIDLASGNYFSRTNSGAVTFSVSNVPASGTTASFILDLTNGGVGAITWWSGVKWAGGTAPTLTSAGRDVLGFFTHDGGTTWTGLVLGKDVK